MVFWYIKWEIQIFCSFAYTPPASRRPDPTWGDKREEDNDDDDNDDDNDDDDNDDDNDDDDNDNDDTTSTNSTIQNFSRIA